MNKNRIQSIDALRFFAILFVIVDHAYLESLLSSGGQLAQFFRKVCNLPVPYFLVVAGYFFGKSIQKTRSIKTSYVNYAGRILCVFFAWSVVYSFPRLDPETTNLIAQYGIIKAYYWNLQYLWGYYKLDPLLLLTTGTNMSFWFFSGLIASVTIVTAFLSVRQEKYLLAFGLLLYLISPLVILCFVPILGGNYDFNPKFGLFTCTVFVAYGWYLSTKTSYSRLATNILLFCGVMLFFVEQPILQHFYHIITYAGRLSYLLIAIGLVRWALSSPQFCENTIFPRLGRFTLGIYCVHMFFLINLKPYVTDSYLTLWNIGVIPILYLLSLLVTLVFKRFSVTRWLVV